MDHVILNEDSKKALVLLRYFYDHISVGGFILAKEQDELNGISACLGCPVIDRSEFMKVEQGSCAICFRHKYT